MYKKMKNILVILLVVSFLLGGAQVVLAEETKAGFAPLNPDFVEYMEKLENQELKRSYIIQDGKKYSFGYIPPTVDLSHNYAPDAFIPDLKSSSSFPGAYDLRDHDRVTAVRDQDPFGTCWAFATMASIESYLKPEEISDFSEYHLAWYAYDGPESFTLHEPTSGILNQGGNSSISIALLSRWSEPYYESDCPYDVSGDIPSIAARAEVSKHLQNARHLTSDEDVKDAIMNVGAVNVMMYFDDGSYNESTSSYYYNPSYQQGGDGHCVTITGWDDDFSASNFRKEYDSGEDVPGSTPPGNGAWLIKNSWGTDFGNNGYFWISYYDSELSDFWSFEVEEVDNYTYIYQHDPLGCINTFGTSDGEDFCANVFESDSRSAIAAVSFYAVANNTSYQIFIGNDLAYGEDPDEGNIYVEQAGTIADPGYYTIPLRYLVPVNAGERFSVMVYLKTPGYDYPIPAEHYIEGISEKASAQPYQSYLSDDGSSWDDATSIDSTMNVCVKAFTKDWPANLQAIQNIYPANGEIVNSSSVTLQWSSAGNDVTYDLYFGSKASKIASNISSTEYTVSNLSDGTIYGWYVVARSSDDVEMAGPASRFRYDKPASGGSGGGCNITAFPIMSVLLLAPLFVLFKK